MPLLPHQDRVVTERAQLDEKIDKLSAFLAGPVVADDASLLWIQLAAMKTYSAVLTARIARFKET